MPQFPQEKSLDFDTIVDLADAGFFNLFEEELGNFQDPALNGATRKDFVFTESNLDYSNDKGYIVARSKNPGLKTVVYDGLSQTLHESADWDPINNCLDLSQCPAVSAANAPAPPLQVNGLQSALNALNGMMPPAAQPGAPIPQPSQTPMTHQQPMQGQVPMRMLGRPQEVIDTGTMGKGKGDEFEKALDALLAAADPAP